MARKCSKCGRRIVKRLPDGLCSKCRINLDLEEMIVPPKRKCHDCGKPTDEYRCEECWGKIHAKMGRKKILEVGGVEFEEMIAGDWIYG